MTKQIIFEGQENAVLRNKNLQEKAKNAAVQGLMFLAGNQCADVESADCGRFPIVYDCDASKSVGLTGNWTTAIALEALLSGYNFTGEKIFLETARRAAIYLKSLQELTNFHPRLRGVFREETPQSRLAFPRDALTAAWALTDWAQLTEDDNALQRAKIFAEWFMNIGMENNVPYWRVLFDSEDWTPGWTGSFHSGSAYFFYKLWRITKEDSYLKTMCRILDYYNEWHIDKHGEITVILDRDTREPLDGKASLEHSNRPWEIMHKYNDDFGALANIAAYKETGKYTYAENATHFLENMLDIQRADGGFGPQNYSIPSAGGTVLLELLAAEKNGIIQNCEQNISRAVQYLLDLQIKRPGKAGNGAFAGFDSKNQVSTTQANMRSTAYAILALLKYAGNKDEIYFVV